jgi:hypothetical protein
MKTESTHEAIELRVNEVAQLFHTLDQFPFRERDFGREAEDFIVGWARELPIDQPIRPRPGQLGHQCSYARGRPNLHLVSSSRRPRRVTGSSPPKVRRWHLWGDNTGGRRIFVIDLRRQLKACYDPLCDQHDDNKKRVHIYAGPEIDCLTGTDQHLARFDTRTGPAR